MSMPASNGVTGNWGKPSGVKKRKADDDLRNEQRLAKRFDLLNLGKADLLIQEPLLQQLIRPTEHNGKLYLPVQHSPARQTRTNGNHESESMQLDDTKDKVYIHNLDDELADIESEEEKLVFLPDIEKKLGMMGKIPKSVLLGEGHPSTGNEMVLYSVPSSLSVPEEQDKVRKAIIESRARAREKQMQDAEVETCPARHVNGGERTGKPNGVSNMGHVAADQVMGIEEDEDAMDLG
ncbi:MAG: hypothetical protein ALECFALPRED_010606 [Alectoria fallacina]|uniref:Uncharacterized protein n=1 Tax=Alectoria fallacina TaxID=1903189 RepID=A0A8H3J9F5_9LECA|nr:MAG: hypothetical protein ALECFALPRED_010606 [Alectoria fallacina]